MGQSGAGYIHARVDGKNILLHRFVWMLKYGQFPSQLDHVNRNKADNRLSNLRIANGRINNINRSTKKRELPQGVYYDKRLKRNPYRASCCGKYIGRFATPEEASAAYQVVAGSLIQAEQSRL